MDYQRQNDSQTHRSHQTSTTASGLSARPKNQARLRIGKSRVTKTNTRKWKPGEKAMREIRQYQKSTDMLIQKVRAVNSKKNNKLFQAPFCRLVHEIMQDVTSSSSDFRIRAEALGALQEAAEAFLVEMFEGSVLIANHAKRVTLMPSDILLYRRLCLRNI